MGDKLSAVSVLTRGTREHELAAILLLIQAKASGMERLSARLVEFGSAVRVLQQIEKENLLVASLTENDVKLALADVEQWIRVKRLDVRAIFDQRYPSNLLSIFNGPPWVFVRGNWSEQRDNLSVAVVGTRKPSADGIRRAQVAAKSLAKAGVTVISGLAAGIDTAAHTAALDAGGRTVAVMGTGITRVYPRENQKLADRIVENDGALISQFVPDQAPSQWTFPMRNVVMSGLSLATLVIEASATSGAKSQARHALEHGRTVFLSKSLVADHDWAKTMVNDGVHGVRAVQFDSMDDIVERLVSFPDAPALAV